MNYFYGFQSAFPIWLAPTHVQIVPVSSVHLDYALNVQSVLRNEGIRVEIDQRNEKLGYKIREAQLRKIPYTFILGDKEVSDGTVNVRKFGNQKTESLSIENFTLLIKQQIE